MCVCVCVCVCACVRVCKLLDMYCVSQTLNTYHCDPDIVINHSLIQYVLLKEIVKMDPLLTLKTAPVNVQEAIQGNIVKVRVLLLKCLLIQTTCTHMLYTIQTTHTVHHTEHTHTLYTIHFSSACSLQSAPCQNNSTC